MTTNYERYFGTPERVVQAFIDHEDWHMSSGDPDYEPRGFIAALMDSWAEFALAHRDTFLRWLQEECDD